MFDERQEVRCADSGRRGESESDKLSIPNPTADLSIFREILQFFLEKEETWPGQIEYLQKALEVVEGADVAIGAKVYCLSPSISLWAERVMAARGASVRMIEGSSTRAIMKERWWLGLVPQLASPALNELMITLRTNGTVEHAVFPYCAPPADSIDVFCMSAVLDSPIDNAEELLLKALETLRPGGRLVIGYHTPSYFNNSHLLEIAARSGYTLEELPSVAFYGDANYAGGIFKVVGKPVKSGDAAACGVGATISASH